MVHIIHNPENKTRKAHLLTQLAWVGITEYTLEPAVVHKSTKAAVKQAHQDVVRRYYDEPEITIFEDDIVFTKSSSWDKYLEWKEELPDNWDVYTGGYYNAVKKQPFSDNLDIIRGIFSGLHCYTIRKKFYDSFLQNDGVSHIDVWIGKKGGVTYVPKLLPTRQMGELEDGYSEREKKKVNYKRYHDKLNFW